MKQPKFDLSINEKGQPIEENAYKKIGELRPHKGHMVFEFDEKTHKIIKAKFEETDDSVVGKQNKRINIRKGCLYVSALNIKNAVRKIALYHGIDLRVE